MVWLRRLIRGLKRRSRRGRVSERHPAFLLALRIVHLDAFAGRVQATMAPCGINWKHGPHTAKLGPSGGPTVRMATIV
jgi:hypothetical protein